MATCGPPMGQLRCGLKPMGGLQRTWIHSPDVPRSSDHQGRRQGHRRRRLRPRLRLPDHHDERSRLPAPVPASRARGARPGFPAHRLQPPWLRPVHQPARPDHRRLCGRSAGHPDGAGHLARGGLGVFGRRALCPGRGGHDAGRHRGGVRLRLGRALRGARPRLRRRSRPGDARNDPALFCGARAGTSRVPCAVGDYPRGTRLTRVVAAEMG